MKPELQNLVDAAARQRKIQNLIAVATEIAEDAELVDGDMWGMLVGVGQMDALRDALDALKERD